MEAKGETSEPKVESPPQESTGHDNPATEMVEREMDSDVKQPQAVKGDGAGEQKEKEKVPEVDVDQEHNGFHQEEEDDEFKQLMQARRNQKLKGFEPRDTRKERLETLNLVSKFIDPALHPEWKDEHDQAKALFTLLDTPVETSAITHFVIAIKGNQRGFITAEEFSGFFFDYTDVTFRASTLNSCTLKQSISFSASLTKRPSDSSLSQAPSDTSGLATPSGPYGVSAEPSETQPLSPNANPLELQHEQDREREQELEEEMNRPVKRGSFVGPGGGPMGGEVEADRLGDHGHLFPHLTHEDVGSILYEAIQATALAQLWREAEIQARAQTDDSEGGDCKEISVTAFPVDALKKVWTQDGKHRLPPIILDALETETGCVDLQTILPLFVRAKKMASPAKQEHMLRARWESVVMDEISMPMDIAELDQFMSALPADYLPDDIEAEDVFENCQVSINEKITFSDFIDFASKIRGVTQMASPTMQRKRLSSPKIDLEGLALLPIRIDQNTLPLMERKLSSYMDATLGAEGDKERQRGFEVIVPADETVSHLQDRPRGSSHQPLLAIPEGKRNQTPADSAHPMRETRANLEQKLVQLSRETSRSTVLQVHEDIHHAKRLGGHEGERERQRLKKLEAEKSSGNESDIESYRKTALYTIMTDPSKDLLPERKVKEMHDLERRAIIVDMLVGFLSGAVTAIAEYFMEKQYKVDGFGALDEEYTGKGSFGTRMLMYWLVVGGISFLLTMAEMMFMYAAHLKMAIKASLLTGVPSSQNRQFILSALARAALELPNPSRSELGVDPLAKCSRWKILLASLIYKAKRSVTTFLLRVVVKRALTRVALKTMLFLPGTGALVNALWNGFIGYKTVRACRVISVGPMLAVAAFDILLAQRRGACAQAVSARTKEVLIRAVSLVIIVKQELHPNLHVLLNHLLQRLTVSNQLKNHGDEELFYTLLNKENTYDRLFATHTLALACLLDGNFDPDLERVLKKSCEVAGLPDCTERVKELTQSFIRSEIQLRDMIEMFEIRERTWKERMSHSCRIGCDRCALCFAC